MHRKDPGTPHDGLDDYRAELAKQEATSSQASAEAARAARKAQIEAQRTAALRRVVEAEERVKAYQMAAVDRAQLYDAAEEAGREAVKVAKRIKDLEQALLQARQERQHWMKAEASHTEAYHENRARWNDGKGAQRELQQAKSALADLVFGTPPSSKMMPKSRKLAEADLEFSEEKADLGWPKLVSPVKSEPVSSAKKSAAASPISPQREARANGTDLASDIRKSASSLRYVLSSPPKMTHARARSISPLAPHGTMRRPTRTVVIPAAAFAAKRRVSEEAEQAAKRARLAGFVKEEEEDPF